jgi:hypothetical protein
MDVLTFIIRQELLRGVDTLPLLIEHGVSRSLENLDTCLWNEADRRCSDQKPKQQPVINILIISSGSIDGQRTAL